MAAALSLDVKVVKAALAAAAVGQKTVSLEGPVRGTRLPLHTMLADEERNQPEATLQATEEIEALRKLLYTALDDTERAAVGLRYGLGGEAPQTYAKVAAALAIENAQGEVDRRRARRLVDRALRKLRQAAEAQRMAIECY